MFSQDSTCKKIDRMLDWHRANIEEAILVRHRLDDKSRAEELEKLLEEYSDKLDPLFCARLNAIFKKTNKHDMSSSYRSVNEVHLYGEVLSESHS
ncbi:hypothetical protein ACQR3P_28875 [Rhodococcus sp. IEGM1300]